MWVLKFYKKHLEKKSPDPSVKASISRIIKIVELSPTKVWSNLSPMEVDLLMAFTSRKWTNND